MAKTSALQGGRPDEPVVFWSGEGGGGAGGWVGGYHEVHLILTTHLLTYRGGSEPYPIPEVKLAGQEARRCKHQLAKTENRKGFTQGCWNIWVEQLNMRFDFGPVIQ